MFHLGEAAWSIAVRTAIIYVAMLVGFRMAGKRELGQMTPFDLVVILLIANAVQNAMVGHDVSVTGGLIAAAVSLSATTAWQLPGTAYPGSGASSKERRRCWSATASSSKRT
jgi:hypothetical protein